MTTNQIITLLLTIGILMLGYVLIACICTMVRNHRKYDNLARTIGELMHDRVLLNRMLWP